MDLDESIFRFQSPLTGLIIAWGVPAVDASEIAADSLADAYLNRGSCSGDTSDPSQYGKWLRGIAKNKFRNWSRSRGRRRGLAESVANETLDSLEASETQAGVEQPDERLLRLRSEIDRLPTKQKQVIIMHYLDETSVADVACLLSITPKAVEGRLYQARKRLRTRMDSQASGSSSSIVKALLL